MPLNIDSHKFFNIGKAAIKQVDLLLEEKHINLEIQSIEDNWIMVDAELIERVMVNFLTNAIKYTPNNGTITLTSKEINQKWIRFSIKDTGQGIPAEKLPNIFDLYNQVDAKRSGKIRSTGIGLAFCKMVVDAHEGDINVESSLNEGTTFHVILAKGEPKAQNGKQVSPSVLAHRRKQFELNDEHKSLLEPISLELQQLKIYQASAIRKIINNLDSEQDIIKNWKKAVLKAAMTSNAERYKQLIHLEKQEI